MDDLNALRARERPSPIFLEITDRDDLGFDLHAPQKAEGGSDRYRLITETKPGDTVLHYHRPSGAIVGVSRVAGNRQAAQILWAAKGTSARARHIQPYWRPSWKVPLVGYEPLDNPLAQTEITDERDHILALKADWERLYGKGSLFPYYRYSKDELRTQQAYLAFFPRSLFRLFPELKRQVSTHERLGPQDFPTVSLDPPDPDIYVANEDTDVDHPGTINVDPAAVAAARNEHARLQNKLRARVLQAGRVLVPPPDTADVDIAWTGPRARTVVAEVKSLLTVNEAHQLRYGLGQLLDYLDEFSASGIAATGVLFVGRPPRKISWLRKCEALGLELCWPGKWPKGL